MKTALALFAVMIAAPSALLQAEQASPPGLPPAVLPAPAKMQPGTGSFTLEASTVIASDAASAATARQLGGYIKPATGFDLLVVQGAPDRGLPAIELSQDKNKNIYQVELKELSNAPLTLRASISTDVSSDSHGRVTLEKVQP
ncbi:MAG: hypothetical protein NTW21_28470 [Verrucomicrobia bacterium]|nr:hypothetical protein [Verrucomicrobiota bacterium]